MTDWLTPDEREPECDCTPTVPQAVAAHTTTCAIDRGASRVDLLDHAAEADRRLAERDDVIRELADTLRAGFEFVERCYFTYDDLAAKQACEKANAALARVDALTGGDAMSGAQGTPQVTAADRPTLPLTPLPDCEHDLEHVAPSIGHAGDLYRCTRCGGYAMRGEPNTVRN